MKKTKTQKIILLFAFISIFFSINIAPYKVINMTQMMMSMLNKNVTDDYYYYSFRPILITGWSDIGGKIIKSGMISGDLNNPSYLIELSIGWYAIQNLIICAFWSFIYKRYGLNKKSNNSKGNSKQNQSNKYSEVYLIRGNEKYEIGDYQGSIQDYNEALKINPYYANAYNNRGLSKYELEDYQGAIQDFDEAIELSQNYSEAYNNRGIIKYENDDYQGAIQDYTTAIELNPSYAAAYNNRGLAKKDLNDMEGACLDWEKAVEFGCIKTNELLEEYCS